VTDSRVTTSDATNESFAFERLAHDTRSDLLRVADDPHSENTACRLESPARRWGSLVLYASGVSGRKAEHQAM
jgi:hypothetical protein